MEVTIWYAVNRSGQGRIFKEFPERNKPFRIWTGESSPEIIMIASYMERNGFRLPDINWNDEPVKLKLTIDYD